MGRYNILQRTLIAIAVSASASIGLVSFAQGSPNSEATQIAARLGAIDMVAIDFEKGSSSLSNLAQEQLSQFISEARQRGDFAEIKVAAWGDQQYPSKGQVLAKSQVDLARERADNIREFLHRVQRVSAIETHNMAERPSQVEQILETTDAQVKNGIERLSVAPTNEDQTGFFKLKGKTSQALIMVYGR